MEKKEVANEIKILVSRVNQHLMINLHGEIVMENSKDFYIQLEDIIKQNKGIINVSFDLGKVVFMDSSGIGTIIKASSMIKSNGGIISVFDLNKSLLAVFKLSGLHNMIHVYTKEEFKYKYPEFSNK